MRSIASEPVGARAGRSGVRAVAVVDEPREVRRADHVEVQVQRDLGAPPRRSGWRRSGSSRPARPPRRPTRRTGPVLGLDVQLRDLQASSRRVAEPEPLSLMPGPAWTLSRCAPAMTTLSGSPARRLGDHVLGGAPLGVRRRLDVHRGAGRTVGRRRCEVVPSAKLVSTAGIVRSGRRGSPKMHVGRGPPGPR